MNEFNLALVAVGGIVLVIGLVSDLFRRTWWLSEPLVALLCGIVLSPAVFGLLHPFNWGIKQEELLEQSARLTLAIGLMGWRGIILVTLVILLRRLPAFLLLNQPLKPLKNRLDVLFTGWFGPIGVSAIYYAGFSLRRTGIEEIWGFVSLAICASLIAHGLTATSFTKFYGRSFRDRARNF